jgi:hypothetical protein
LTDDADDYVGKLISRVDIEKWYKLATGTSRFNTQELVDLYDGTDNAFEFPKWQNLIPTEIEGMDKITFNADYMKVMQDLDGSKGMTWGLTGRLRPIKAETDRGLYVVMPMKD